MLIAIIHDETIDLQNPKDPSQLWIRTIIENLNVGCQTPISTNIIQMSSEVDLMGELIQCKLHSSSLTLC